MRTRIIRYTLWWLFLPSMSMVRDLVLEFKMGAFLPTASLYKDIYGAASLFYNPECMIQLKDQKPWHLFFSALYTSKRGHSVGYDTPTKIEIIPLGIGLKYAISFYNGTFYVGLGFQPAYLRTFNSSEFIQQQTAKWGMGGIAKLGYYLDLSQNFSMNLFCDYSFVHVGSRHVYYGNKSCCSSSPFSNSCINDQFVVPFTSNISGALIGVGLGYSF
ncbi:hypothetical protein HYV11_00655 [Candidatus Dependentiae bacterium]|nr:hypothetical protein [Candidatus Dependentiae bacterium]